MKPQTNKPKPAPVKPKRKGPLVKTTLAVAIAAANYNIFEHDL